MAERAEDLAADGLDIDGNAWDSEPVDATDPKSPRRRRSAQKLEEKSPGGAADEMSSGLRNVQLNHVVGFETDYLALRRLPVRRADLALIIADSVKPPGQAMISDPNPSPSPSPNPNPNPSPNPSPNPNQAATGWSEPQMNDSGAMTSSILLRRLRDEVTAGLEGADRPPPLQVGNYTLILACNPDPNLQPSPSPAP